MTMRRSSTRRDIYLEAAEWFTRMQAENVSMAERAGFSEWLSESAAHVEEYLKIATMWRQLGEADVSPEDIDALLAAAREATEARNVVQFHANGRRGEAVTVAEDDSPLPTHSQESTQSGAHVASQPRLRWAAAMALALVATYSSWLAVDRHYYGTRYSTEVGQQMTFSLADGSVILLNTQSEVRVRISDSERRINLLAGEAMFEVAKDPNRPFRVEAGGSVVEAVGTVFNVYRQDHGATVTVVEGKVIVATSKIPLRTPEAAADAGSASLPIDTATGQRAGSEAMPPDPKHPTAIAMLGTNEQARISSEGLLLQLQQVSADRVTAWTDRRLIFEGTTLADIVSEFNRYNVRRLRVDDTQLAAIRINAMFNASDPESLIDYLKKTEGVSVQRSHDGTSVLYKEKLNRSATSRAP